MKKLFFIIIFATCATFAMDEDGWASTYESMAAFDSHILVYGNRPGYVKPIIENLGNVLNSNWYVSASVAKSLSIEWGLPFAIITTDGDKTFTENGQSVPTIFGTHHNMQEIYDGKVYGNETLNGLGVFTYPYMQLGVSFFYARLVLRGMWLPSISELRKFNDLGFGLQYSFGHLFKEKLPSIAKPLDVSLVFGYNSSGIGYRPDDYGGELELDVSTVNVSMVMGYKLFSFFEVLMSLGYQYASMEASGHLTCNKLDNADYGKEVHPNITVKGNNGFRFGIAIALQLGSSYHPVIGYDYAGSSSFTTNLIYFKQQFGNDESEK